MGKSPPENKLATKVRPFSSIIWLIAASLLPLVLVSIKSLIHLLRSAADYSFSSPGTGLIFYVVWGAALAITTRQGENPIALIKIALFIFSALVVNFIKILSILLMPGMDAASYVFLWLGLVHFLWVSLHLVFAGIIFQRPVKLTEVLAAGCLVTVLVTGFYLFGLSTSTNDATNPNMVAYSIQAAVRYAGMGIFLSLLATRKPFPRRKVKTQILGIPIFQTLTSFTSWPFGWLLIFATTNTSMQKCGDPLIACFILSIIGGMGIVLFSGISLLWGIIRLPEVRESHSRRITNYALMVIGGTPLSLPVIYILYTLIWR